MPVKLLQSNFENGNCVKQYMQLVQATGKYVKDRAFLIDHGESTQAYMPLI